jgi:hypothetical protein
LALGSTENDSSNDEEEEEDTSGKRMRDSDEEMPDYHAKYIKNVHKKKNKKKNKRKIIHA